MTKLQDLPQRVQVTVQSTPPRTFNFQKGIQTTGSPGSLAYIDSIYQYPHITIVGNEGEHFRKFHITDEINGQKIRVYYVVRFAPTGSVSVAIDQNKRVPLNAGKYWKIADGFVNALHGKKPLTEKESETEENPLIWQGLTLDEHILQLPDLVLDRNISHFLKQPSFKKLVKSQYRGNIKEAIARSIAHLAQYSLCTGSIVYPGLSRKLRVFETQDAYGTNYQIYTWPLSSTQSLILTLQQAQPMSEEVDFFEGGTNIPNLLLKNAVNDDRLDAAGTYRITWKDKDGKPHVYDGKAGGGKNTVKLRLRHHHQELKSLVGADSNSYRVSVQLMPVKTTKSGTPSKHPAKLTPSQKKILTQAEKDRIEESKTKAKQGKVISTNERVGEMEEFDLYRLL